MKADDIRRVIDRADVEFSDGEKEELLNTLVGTIHDTAMITGVVTAEEVESVDHHDDCDGVQWVTSHKADALELDEYDDLDDSTAVCDNCGVEADIGDVDREENVIVDVSGAEDITDLIATGSGVSY
ncbi:MAG: hypothetical protein SVU88_02300, partial [Candidatus Nanohaloarchaea archaeon]|nr:hypothetical protein [Candidatus Nanohaloarchaea archaeon]